MKKLLALFFVFTATATAQAALTGSITLSGVIPASTSITVSPVAGYNNLDLSVTSTDLLVANVTEKNNTQLGYKVTASSANAGNLKNGTLGSIPYTAKYNGTSFTLSVTPVQVTNQTSQVTPNNTVKALAISFAAQDPESLMAGTYSDTLTLTISAN